MAIIRELGIHIFTPLWRIFHLPLRVKSAVDFQGMPDHIKKLVCNFYKLSSSALIVSRKVETNKTTGKNTEQKSTADLTPPHLSVYQKRFVLFYRKFIVEINKKSTRTVFTVWVLFLFGLLVELVF